SGLDRDIPQAEGIASDDRNSLWIVSEPDRFYRFSQTMLL
ncbi:SdiA-regulated domain-containing protein, partial [Salmonella enterica]|nr:SdiA-regulated domain-containing protein [Salmonella enterica]